MRFAGLFSVTAILACALAPAPAQTRRPARTAPADASRKVNIPYDEARPVLEAAEPAVRDALPAELRGKSPAEMRAAWPGWVARRDADIRARLAQGDEDTLVNFMLFGVSFTRQPRATPKDIARFGEGKSLGEVVAARLDDLVAGIAAPGANERLRFARGVVERKGIDPATPAGRPKVKEFLLATMQRVLAEVNNYTRAIEAARLLGDPSAEFVERSTLYRDRGLSSDTSIFPDFAIEQSLEAMKAQGLLAPGSVRRVACIRRGGNHGSAAGPVSRGCGTESGRRHDAVLMPEPADPSLVHAHARRPVACSRMIKACRVKKRQVGVVRRATATIVVDLKHLVLRINHDVRRSRVP